MKLESALNQLLPPYLSRVQVRPGNGLSRSMNGTLRSQAEIPVIIKRTVECLASLEYLLGFSGSFGIHYRSLYHVLINTYDDWFLEIPHFPSSPGAGPLTFVRKPRVPIHRFLAAWTIARRINLVSGRGQIRLHSDVLARLRQLVPTTQTNPPKGGTPRMGDRGPPF